ncbi:MAG: class I SAM-dependent methyltransferase [Candidatus Riflebacteria bacterium]|nr:class I SAM-dependent methyltransferase [Candidatus Riflebacteria bacterium]
MKISGNSDFVVISTREGYDIWSEIYDSEDNPLIASEKDKMPALIGDVKGKRILDVGCGTGRHSILLASMGAQVTGIDFSEKMLQKAREKINSERVEFRHTDFSRGIPFPDETFDMVVSCLVFDHIHDVGTLMKNMARVCTPSGKIVISVMHPAMSLKGIQARFVHPTSGKQIRPESAENTISDYVMSAVDANLTIEFIKEYKVDEALCAISPRAQKYLGWPLLLLMKLAR